MKLVLAYHKNSVRLLRYFPIILSLLVVLQCGSSLALEIRSGENVFVSEKINDDLLMSGTDGMFDGELRGDVIALCFKVTIDGKIDGNVNAAGTMVIVSGTTYRSVRMAGLTLIADGLVRNNLVMAGVDVRVTNTCEVGNDVHIIGEEVNVSGTIHGNLDIKADKVVILGNINDDVSISCNKLLVERSAVILGDLTYTSPNKAEITSGAQIDGEQKWSIATDEGSSLFGSFISKIVLFVGAFLVGLLVFGLCHSPACNVKKTISADLLRSLGIGIVTFVLAPVALLLALLTVFGAPAAIVGLLIYVVLFYLSKLFVAAFLGEKVIRLFSSSEPKSHALSLFLGLLILWILFSLPYIGWLFYLLSVITGLGGIAIAFSRSRKEARAARSSGSSG